MVQKKSAETLREKPIRIENKSTKQTGEALPSALDKVWSKRGWTRVDDKSSESTSSATTEKEKS